MAGKEVRMLSIRSVGFAGSPELRDYLPYTLHVSFVFTEKVFTSHSHVFFLFSAYSKTAISANGG